MEGGMQDQDLTANAERAGGRGAVFTFDDKAGGNFIRFMEDKGVHPVLVFGNQASGKSTMLLSMLAYAMGASDAGLGVGIGQDPFPPSIEDAQARYNRAKEFLNVKVPAFSHGTMPPATTTANPFFIPVDIEVRGFGETPKTCKLAFLEGQGEWFEMDAKTGIEFKEMKPEITAILKRFPNPISVIFVAPCVHPLGRSDLDYSHRCLSNCVDQYKRLRGDRANDHLLLVMAKWDDRHRPGTPGFNNPSADLLMEDLKKWNFIWSAYSTLGGVASKSLLPYSAGVISDGSVNPSGEHKTVLDRYNRILLNWLIGNATQTKAGKLIERPIPYPDAAPPYRVMPSNMDRAIDLILGHR